jgi:RNA polymerase sigma factor (sigma-70 family)
MRLLEEGDDGAARALWERYFERLVGLARRRLEGAPRGAADEEDVALSALDSFCRGAAQGRFTDLLGRDSLWRMLVHITAHKVLDHVRRERAKMRGGDAAPLAEADLDQVVGSEPTPEFAAQVAEECQRLLGKLGDATLRAVALRRMEGHSVEEAAAQIGCSPVTVKRKLARIRSIWAGEIQP